MIKIILAILLFTVPVFAGTMFLMWLGEQITERGVGNGISMIIFAGIVAGLPNLIMQSFTSIDSGQSSLIGLAIFGLLSVGVLAAIVFIEKAQRRIPVNYAQKQQGRRLIFCFVFKNSDEVRGINLFL